MDPTMGRIVYYTPSDPNDVSAVEAPAIVSRVNADGTLDLTVFPPSSSPYSVDNVDQSGSGSSENGKWCWPPAAPSGSAPESTDDTPEEPAQPVGGSPEGESEAPAAPEGDQGGPEEPQEPAEGQTSEVSEKALYVVNGADAGGVPEGLSESGLETPDGDTLYHYVNDQPDQPGVFKHNEIEGGDPTVELYADAADNDQPVCPAAGQEEPATA